MHNNKLKSRFGKRNFEFDYTLNQTRITSVHHKTNDQKFGRKDIHHNVTNEVRFIEAMNRIPKAAFVIDNIVYVTSDDETVYDVAAIIGPKSTEFLRAKRCIANETSPIARKAMRRKLLVALVLKGYKVVQICVR